MYKPRIHFQLFNVVFFLNNEQFKCLNNSCSSSFLLFDVINSFLLTWIELKYISCNHNEKRDYKSTPNSNNHSCYLAAYRMWINISITDGGHGNAWQPNCWTEISKLEIIDFCVLFVGKLKDSKNEGQKRNRDHKQKCNH